MSLGSRGKVAAMKVDIREANVAFALLLAVIVGTLVLQGCLSANTPEEAVRPTAISARRASPRPRTSIPTVEIAVPTPVPPTLQANNTAALATPSPATKRITLTLWVDYPDVLEKAFEATLDEYQREHPTVSVVVSKSVDILGQLTGTSSGAGHPDLFSLTSDRIGGMAEAGFIIPLNQFARTVGPQVQGEYEPLAKDGVMYGDYFWAFPQAMGGLAWVYNPKLVPNPPDSIDRFLSEGGSFQRTHPGYVYFDYPGRGNPYFNAPWFYGLGGYYLSGDGKVGVSTDGGLRGALLVQNLSRLMPPKSTEPPENRFMEGKQAWLMTEGTFLGMLEQQNVPFALAQWPVLDGIHRAKPLVVTWGLAISASTRHPEEAATLAYYLSTEKFASRLADQLAFVPAYKQFNDLWLKSHGDSMLARRIQQLRMGTPFPNHPAMDLLWMPLSDMWEAIWQGGDAKFHLKKAQDAMDQLLKAANGGNP